MASISKNGVLYLSEPKHQSFEALYVKQREFEQRLLTDEQVEQLPNLTDHPLAEEWMLRKQSTDRFLQYFDGKPISTVLEVGCGNGWFSHLIAAQLPSVTVWGTDVNVQELEQAARVFKQVDNLRFAHWDIFEKTHLIQKPGLIVLNASIQYFPDLIKLFNRLFEILKAYGEIHVLDSPFYKEDEQPKAEERSKGYYQKAGVAELAKFYHHHTLLDLERKYTVEKLFDPSTPLLKVKRLFGKKQSPFMWLKITK